MIIGCFKPEKNFKKKKKKKKKEKKRKRKALFYADSHYTITFHSFLCSSLNKSLFTSVVSHQLARMTTWVYQTIKTSFVFFCLDFFFFLYILYLFIAFKFKHLFFCLIFFFPCTVSCDTVTIVSSLNFLLFCCFEFVYCFRL